MLATARIAARALPKSAALLSNAAIATGMRPVMVAGGILSRRWLSDADRARITKMRNIGISAHIDSGKTTSTERILYYTGRIREIHEVRGKDGVGAKMDSMDLEREKGITIQSAATFCQWGDTTINVIDTPGHVDFTIEVERALRVLDGAVMLVCAASGVQSQTSTVDRQMRRYNVPRICFINKCDRAGANPWKAIEQMRTKLHLNCGAVQMPMGTENAFEGVIDLVRRKALYFDGANGEKVRVADVPEKYKEEMEQRRNELLERLAEVDDEVANHYLNGTEMPEAELKAAIRRLTLSLQFAPVFMGSAVKNKGVQPLLDGVTDYLPSPLDKRSTCLDLSQDEKEVELTPDPALPFVGLAFKLEEGRFGQLTYLRVYQGSIRRGDTIVNTKTNKKVKVPRVIRMHSNEMEEVEELKAGEIGALFGIECSSGDTFTDGRLNYSMTSMYVPQPVISLAITPKSKDSANNFSRALQRFQKEDPTFRVHVDPESSETIISGMGELHLEIYVERMKREYNCECVVGKPRVAFRETITQKVPFNYTHKKQSGGAGQFARVIGFLEPMSENLEELSVPAEYENRTVGGAIPASFFPACQKGFEEAVQKGPLTQSQVTGVRMVLTDGLAHAVDSNEISFRTATLHAFRTAFKEARPVILEPIMAVEIVVPSEYQGAVMGEVNRRKGLILSTEVQNDYCTIQCEVPLNQMFGYSTDLRSLTQGKGEFSMEYKRHSPVTQGVQEELIKEFEKKRAAERS